MKILHRIRTDPALRDTFTLLVLLIAGVYFIAIPIKFPAAGIAIVALYLWFRSRRRR
jgi:hypothetical protein